MACKKECKKRKIWAIKILNQPSLLSDDQLLLESLAEIPRRVWKKSFQPSVGSREIPTQFWYTKRGISTQKEPSLSDPLLSSFGWASSEKLGFWEKYAVWANYRLQPLRMKIKLCHFRAWKPNERLFKDKEQFKITSHIHNSFPRVIEGWLSQTTKISGEKNESFSDRRNSDIFHLCFSESFKARCQKSFIWRVAVFCQVRKYLLFINKNVRKMAYVQARNSSGYVSLKTATICGEEYEQNVSN